MSRSSRRRTLVLAPRIESLEGRALLAAATVSSPVQAVLPPAAERAAHRLPSAGGRVVKQIVYTTRQGIAQRLDIYLPAGTPPPGGWPVMLAIHGGGWRKFSKEQYGPKVASSLVPAGYAVVAPNYSLSTRSVASWPLNMEQLQDALRWIGVNARTHSLDAGRIAAMGESAGGHLAAMLGTDPGPGASSGLPGPPRVRAVVSFYGPTDLLALSMDSPSARPAVRQLLGVEADLTPDLARDASPVAHASAGDAPTLLIHGTSDGLVPYSQSQVLYQALRRAGVDSELVLVPGASHGFGFRVGSTNLLPTVLGFLDRSLNGGR